MKKMVIKDFDTKDNSDRHIGDQEIRERGFTIHSRPRNGEVLWKRGDGTVMTQEEVLKVVKGTKS